MWSWKEIHLFLGRRRERDIKMPILFVLLLFSSIVTIQKPQLTQPSGAIANFPL